jgi:hypothetical protein
MAVPSRRRRTGSSVGGRRKAGREKDERERAELSTRRDTEHRGAFSGQRHSEPRPCPSADTLDEKPLMSREPFPVKDR